MGDIAAELQSRPLGRRPLSVRVEWNDPATVMPTAEMLNVETETRGERVKA